MKHVTYGEKALLLDDDSADWLMEYARALGSANMVDSLTLRAIGMDGNETDATFLLNAGTVLMLQSTNSSMQPPTNDETVGYMQEQTRLILSPPPGRTIEDPVG